MGIRLAGQKASLRELSAGCHAHCGPTMEYVQRSNMNIIRRNIISKETRNISVTMVTCVLMTKFSFSAEMFQYYWTDCICVIFSLLQRNFAKVGIFPIQEPSMGCRGCISLRMKKVQKVSNKFQLKLQAAGIALQAKPQIYLFRISDISNFLM